jgi:hypothetical protein
LEWPIVRIVPLCGLEDSDIQRGFGFGACGSMYFAGAISSAGGADAVPAAAPAGGSLAGKDSSTASSTLSFPCALFPMGRGGFSGRCWADDLELGVRAMAGPPKEVVVLQEMIRMPWFRASIRVRRQRSQIEV